jgi:hypothetical protein
VAGRFLEQAELGENSARERDVFYQRGVGLRVSSFRFEISDFFSPGPEALNPSTFDPLLGPLPPKERKG